MKKLEDFVRMKCEAEEDIELLQRVLSKTSWLNKFEPEEITLQVLEKLYWKIVRKYHARIAYIQHAGDDSFIAMIKLDVGSLWLESVYFIGFFEGMAKAILVLYGYFIKGINFKCERAYNEIKNIH